MKFFNGMDIVREHAMVYLVIALWNVYHLVVTVKQIMFDIMEYVFHLKSVQVRKYFYQFMYLFIIVLSRERMW